MHTPLEIPRSRIAELCRRHQVGRLALFGSVTRPDFGPDSDVDILVEFEPDHVPGLAFFTLQAELAELLGRPVDLYTPAWLGPSLRDRIQIDEQLVYDAA